MGTGKWMVLMLMAGVGIGVAAGGMATSGMHHWAERFGRHDDANEQDLVAFDGAEPSHAMRGSMHHQYSDEDGYPLEASDGAENGGGDAGYAPRPVFRQTPPGQMVILQELDANRSDGAMGNAMGNRALVEVAPRARVNMQAPQYAPAAPARAPSAPRPPARDAAAAAAERAMAAAADVTAAERALR